VLQPVFHGPVFSRCVGCSPRFLPFSKRHSPGDPRSAPASRRAQTSATAAALEVWRPLLLDRPTPLLAPLVQCPPDCPTRNRRRLAPRRLSTLLALAVSSARRQTEDHSGTEGFDRTSGPRECRLGRSQNSRRTAEAWF